MTATEVLPETDEFISISRTFATAGTSAEKGTPATEGTPTTAVIPEMLQKPIAEGTLTALGLEEPTAILATAETPGNVYSISNCRVDNSTKENWNIWGCQH